MKRTLSLPLITLVALAMLPGCSYLRSRFGDDRDEYRDSVATAPLQIPEGLDAPNRSGALAIPEPTVASESVPDAAVPDIGVVTLGASDPGKAPQLGGDGLKIADTLSNTWRRVGLALERSGVATITARDADALTFDVQAKAYVNERPGLFKRVFTLGMARDKRISTPVNLRVRVSGTDGACVVGVEGSAGDSGRDAAREILETLRQRMT